MQQSHINYLPGQIKVRRIYKFLMACLFVTVVVLPNSLKSETSMLMVISFFVALPIIKWNKRLLFLGFLYLLSSIVTLIYLLVGLFHNSPDTAIQQILIIYIVSPLMWIIICIALFQCVSLWQINNFLIILAILCCISVALFFFLYLKYGSSSVSFFIESPNLNFGNGYVAATMFVYGSLIFLCGAFFAVPIIIESSPLRFLVLVSLALCAVTSGRSALILSISVGIVVGVFVRTEGERFIFSGSGLMKMFKSVFLILISISLVITFLSLASDIVMETIYQDFTSELSEGGGEERVGQFFALLDGIYQSHGIGAGHGVGVEYIRSEEFPWRYELVWPATIFRVGIIGALVYAMPFLIYIYLILKISIKKGLSRTQKFFFGGFISAFIASNTNPYIEAFCFQWMYVAPLIAFISLKESQCS